jgi:hypothetical protein
MSSLQASSIESGTSPRSTVLAGSDHMSTGIDSMHGDTKVASPAKERSPDEAKPGSTAQGDGKGSGSMLHGPITPDLKGGLKPEQSTEHEVKNQPHLAAASGGYNYIAYDVAPPSPPVLTSGATSLPYEAALGSFIQQQTFAAAHNSPFAIPGAHTPLSPPRSTINMVPPASPLFPRAANGGMEPSVVMQQQTPQSPSIAYHMSPSQQFSAYPHTTYAPTGRLSQASLSSDDLGWDRYVMRARFEILTYRFDGCSHLVSHFSRRFKEPKCISFTSNGNSRHDVWYGGKSRQNLLHGQ